MNEELNVIIYDRGVAQQFERTFLEDIALSQPVTYEGWKKRGLAAKMLELLALPLRDLL